MGLDMYLSKKTYVKRWEHQTPKEKHSVTVNKGAQPHPTIKTDRVSYVVEEIGYWRKANQIHAWFVDNVQDGVDDCKDYYVEIEKLKELLDICIEIKGLYAKNKQKFREYATEKLPTRTGFFFGDDRYEDNYMYDINNTIEILQDVYEQDADWFGDYTYQSSW